MPAATKAVLEVTNVIELWKAIHGGCWPGPPPDNLQISEAVEEVIAGLAVYNLSRSFSNHETASSLKSIATKSLNQSLAGLQKTIGAQG